MWKLILHRLVYGIGRGGPWRAEERRERRHQTGRLSLALKNGRMLTGRAVSWRVGERFRYVCPASFRIFHKRCRENSASSATPLGRKRALMVESELR